MHKHDLRIKAGITLLAIADLHIPYQKSSAVNKAIGIGKKAKCQGVVILGDLVDFHKVSRYRHDADAKDIRQELKFARHWLRVLKLEFSNVWYIPGNHEDRLDAYIADNAPSLGVLEELRLENLLKLDEIGVKYVPGFIHCGDISFLHGHEFRISGMDPARKLFGKMKRSAICGHLHRPDSYYTRDGAGNMLHCHVLGHLGKESPAYMPRNDWQHGCAVVSVNKSGKSSVDTHIF
jgi:predicted phosphodiesterase